MVFGSTNTFNPLIFIPGGAYLLYCMISDFITSRHSLQMGDQGVVIQDLFGHQQIQKDQIQGFRQLNDDETNVVAWIDFHPVGKNSEIIRVHPYVYSDMKGLVEYVTQNYESLDKKKKSNFFVLGATEGGESL